MLFYKRHGAVERPCVTGAAVGAAELAEARVSAVISTAAPALAFTAADVTAAAAIATTALAVAAAVTAAAPGTRVRRRRRKQNTWHDSFRTAAVACAHALSNEGNTCFANGILQILMACQAFEDALTSHASQACL